MKTFFQEIYEILSTEILINPSVFSAVVALAALTTILAAFLADGKGGA